MKDQLGEFACRYSYLDTCSYSRHIQYCNTLILNKGTLSRILSHTEYYNS